MSEENTAAEATETQETAPATEPVVETQTNTEAAPVADDSTETAEEATPTESPDWFMKDKYKTVEDQAKAYKELSSKIGKNWGAPKDDYSTEGIEGISKDDPLIANLAPAFKEIGLSQDGFQNLVKSYQQANVAMVKKFEEELTKELTQNDAATYNAVSKWMQETLKPDEIEQVKNNWLMTPTDFKLFNSLRLMAAPSSNVPSAMDSGGARFETSRSVENDKIKYRKEVKEKLRVPDKNYENELAQRFRDALTREERAKR